MNARANMVVVVAASLLCFPVAAQAQPGNIENLCRLHGIEQGETLTMISDAYAAAVKAGIGEEELLPFVEDILEHKLDCEQMVRVLRAAAELRKDRLPYQAVFSKVREGVAKNAPPGLVVAAAESKHKSLYASRDVLESLGKYGYEISDFRNAAVIVSSYIEKGYGSDEIISQIRDKGIQGAGFDSLSGVVEKKVKRKER